MSEAIRTSRSLDWNPVKFQLTEETPEGPPAVGFVIDLSENLGRGAGVGPGGREPPQRVTDRSGVAEFGLVHPGDYVFHIVKLWDQGSVTTSGQLRVDPGSQVTKRVVCPKVPPQRVPMLVRWTWPPDLAKEKLLLYASFALSPMLRNGTSWALSDERSSHHRSERDRLSFARNGWAPVRRSVLCGPAASLAQVLPSLG
jgi:hypothetical protein